MLGKESEQSKHIGFYRQPQHKSVYLFTNKHINTHIHMTISYSVSSKNYVIENSIILTLSPYGPNHIEIENST